MFTCPVCFFEGLEEPPVDYNICDCCGTEFGSDDEVWTHAQLRVDWIARGAKWFFLNPPFTWNPWQQLAEAGVTLPYSVSVMYAISPNPVPQMQSAYLQIGPQSSVTYGHIIGPEINAFPAYTLVSTPPLNVLTVGAETRFDGKFTDEPLGIAA